MPETYEPDSQFVDRLEWQLASEFRRARQLRSAAKIAVPRQAVVLAVLAGVLLAGVAATKAADLIKDSWRRKLDLAKAETDVRLQRAWSGFRNERAAEAEKRFSMGLIPQEDSLVAKLGADLSALDLRKSELNLWEVQASGKAPQNDLYAPLVAGRDLVAERLEIGQRMYELSLELRRSRISQGLRARVEMGLVSPNEMKAFLSKTDSEQAEIESFGRRIDLRRQFIEGSLSAEAVEISDRMALAERDLRLAQLRVDSVQRDLEEKRRRFTLGETPETEIQALQLGLTMAEEELALAKLEVEILKSVRQDR